MSHTILRHNSGARGGFTLVEAITGAFVALYVFLGAWSIYMMGWGWWHQIAPRIEAQRIARITLTSVIDGYTNFTDTDGSIVYPGGSYNIGSATYWRRNGLAWAMFDTDNVPPTTPTISADNRQIDFMLESDVSGVVRSFYLGVDPATGLSAVFYRDHNNKTYMLRPTVGITDLTFDYLRNTDGSVKCYDVVVVTSVVKKYVDTYTGKRYSTKPSDIPEANLYAIEVIYSNNVYLRNIKK